MGAILEASRYICVDDLWRDDIKKKLNGMKLVTIGLIGAVIMV